MKFLHQGLFLLIITLSGCNSNVNFNSNSTKTIQTKIFDKNPTDAAKGALELSSQIFNNFDEYCGRAFGNESYSMHYYSMQIYSVKSDGSTKDYTVVGTILLHMIDAKAKVLTVDGDFSIPSFIKDGNEVGQYRNKIIKEFKVEGETWYGIYSAKENTLIDYTHCSDVKVPNSILKSRMAVVNSKETLDALINDTITASMFL